MLTEKVLRVAEALLLLTIVGNYLLSLAMHFPTSAWFACTLGYLANSPQQNLFLQGNLQTKATGRLRWQDLGFSPVHSPQHLSESPQHVRQNIWAARLSEVDFGMHLVLHSA